MGDLEGCFLYRIPDAPAADTEWQKIRITDDHLNDRVDIHSGFFPAGVGDLDGDRDAGIFLAHRWLANRSGGKQRAPQRVSFGKRRPWGFLPAQRHCGSGR